MVREPEVGPRCLVALSSDPACSPSLDRVSGQQRLVPIPQPDPGENAEPAIVEVDGVPLATCPECGEEGRDVVYINGAPHAACDCPEIT